MNTTYTKEKNKNKTSATHLLVLHYICCVNTCIVLICSEPVQSLEYHCNWSFLSYMTWIHLDFRFKVQVGGGNFVTRMLHDSISKTCMKVYIQVYFTHMYLKFYVYFFLSMYGIVFVACLLLAYLYSMCTLSWILKNI